MFTEWKKDVRENTLEIVVNVRGNCKTSFQNISHFVPKIDEARLWLLSETAPNIACFARDIFEVPNSLLLVVIDCIVAIVKGKLEGT